ncbi:RIO1 family regulatory kinase/ATPase domain-containing protein [Sutterella sp.]|uniref:RIO1 family regulatory kinase/ATPase domain-containing protein n=1 Tax=Sutterella sp. TaxID=1981025 RepID=UPI003FD78EB7
MQQAEHPPAAVFTRREFEALPRDLLRDGRSANACVWRVRACGRSWTVKDFSRRSWYVRTFVAPLLIRRELATLVRLRGVDGVAQAVFRLDRSAIAMEYAEGTAICDVDPKRITPDYLRRLEALIAAIHRRGVVHLDLRGGGNVIVRPDGTPALIDFQTALFTEGLPARLVRMLEALDFSGAYKKWLRYQPAAMGPARRTALKRVNRLRRLWFLRGYPGTDRRG